MKLLKNRTYIHGFEDYVIVSLSDGCFYYDSGFWIPYSIDLYNEVRIITEGLPVKISTEENYKFNYYEIAHFDPEICSNHVELLEDAKKVFVHQNCKISRSLLAEKYKKSLNPYLSDAVVIPKPVYDDLRLLRTVLFMNENAKMIVQVILSENDGIDYSSDNFKEGDWFENLIPISPNYIPQRQSYNVSDMLHSELFYVGNLLCIPNSSEYILDILTSQIPADKIVYEDSIMESLGCESNQLSFDSLTSIKDMLDSTDANTVAAGLKSLSMMDWMHYTNSVKYILQRASKTNWIYNKAAYSTSVKYMLMTLSESSNRRRWPGDFDISIYEQDFELFKQLKMHYDKITEDKIMEDIRFMHFMTVNSDGILCPNIKEKAV